MFSKLATLHSLILVPTVIVLWFAGSTMFVLFLSWLNVPGVNSHGSGLLFLFGAWLLALVASLIHIGLILKARRAP